MSLARADAEPVFRCGYRLEQVGEDVRTAAARTAGAYPDDWRGDAGIAYQQRLDETADRVRRVAAAYEAAGAALVPYARALVEAQELAWRGDALLSEAADAALYSAAVAKLARLDGDVDAGPAGALREAAARLHAEAAEVERRAAAVCAAALEDEAARAPAVSRWRSVDRFVGDVARVGVDTVAGVASLIGTAWHSLPGVGDRDSRGEARYELLEGAKAAAAIWNVPIDVAHAFADDRPGLALGAAASAFGPGRLAKWDRTRIRDPHLAYREGVREAERRARLDAIVGVRRQTAEDMGRYGVSLVNEEKRGGHVLLKHVAATRGYLLQRNREGFGRAGTFRDVPTAERLVNAVLREFSDRLPEAYTLTGKEKLVLKAYFDFSTGRVTVPGSSRTLPAHAVTVCIRLEGGQPLVYTAFPDL